MIENRQVKILSEHGLLKLITTIVHHIEDNYSRTLDEEYQKIKDTMMEVHLRGKTRAMPSGLAYIGKQIEADPGICDKPTFALYHEPEVAEDLDRSFTQDFYRGTVGQEIQKMMDMYHDGYPFGSGLDGYAPPIID